MSRGPDREGLAELVRARIARDRALEVYAAAMESRREAAVGYDRIAERVAPAMEEGKAYQIGGFIVMRLVIGGLEVIEQARLVRVD